MQLNKYDSPEYGKELFKPNILLEKAINVHQLSDKLMLGFNASGFYLKDTFDAYTLQNVEKNDLSMSREEAIQTVAATLGG